MRHLLTILLCNFFVAQHPSDNVIKGKLVYSSCAGAVVQILDSDYYYLGQAKWKHSDNETEYNHVFAIRNRCNFLKTDIKNGGEFSFKVLADDSNNEGCVQCLMYDHLPYAKVTIEVVTNKP